MASGSPSVSRGRGGGLARAETNPRTLVGLHRVNAQLQQELDKIDRQAFTAVSNIANHQQAMKMSWRRLENQRNSPKTRARAGSCPEEPNPTAGRRGLMMSSNKTRLYVSATPQIYSGTSSDAGGDKQQPPSSQDGGEGTAAKVPAIHVVQDDIGPTRSTSRVSSRHGSLHAPIVTSPYISSPYMYRRGSSPDAFPATSSTSSNASTTQSPLVTSSSSSSVVKLPPILSSTSQPSLVATTNKDTLLKLSHMMGLDSHSHGPKSFRGFYSDRASLATARQVDMTIERSPDTMENIDDDGDEDEKKTTDQEKELSLAEQFEQIRHCRYIRHYRPDGTAIDDPYELDH